MTLQAAPDQVRLVLQREAAVRQNRRLAAVIERASFENATWVFPHLHKTLFGKSGAELRQASGGSAETPVHAFTVAELAAYIECVGIVCASFEVRAPESEAEILATCTSAARSVQTRRSAFR